MCPILPRWAWPTATLPTTAAVSARRPWWRRTCWAFPSPRRRARLKVKVTEDAQEALRFLQEGRGMVIANTYGDRPEHIGVFSDSGHYIVLAAAQGTEVKVWDPMYKEGSGRYDVPGRKGKVRLDGTDAYADFSEIEQDCFERPYFLFWKE